LKNSIRIDYYWGIKVIQAEEVQEAQEARVVGSLEEELMLRGTPEMII
jgi:hypothetical protein